MPRERAYTSRAQGALPRRAYLGLELSKKPSVGGGAQVEAVAADGGGDALGLVTGDVVIELDGQAIADADALAAGLAERRAGDVFELTWRRGDALHHGTLRARPLPTETMDDGDVELDQVAWRGQRVRTIYTAPRGAAPSPAVMILQGADWGSCEHPFRPSHPMRQLVARLTAAGYVTLRVERPGCGDSEGPGVADLDFAGELEAFEAGVQQLLSRPNVARGRVWLLGNSLGGMFAPILAARYPELAGVAVLGTTCASWHECLLAAFVRQQQRARRPPAALERDLAQLRELQELVLRGGRTPVEVYRARPDLHAAGFTHYQGEQAFGRTVRFYQELEAIDLVAAWQRVVQPVLAMHGSDDWICTRNDALAIAAACDHAEVRELAGVDHGLAEPNAAARVVDAFVEWAQTRTGSSSSSGHTRP